ncbi:unnamed protein product [Thelazia callipaeda]|uniref:Clathrin light chain n=1 Tax=Thelazia callipaeda TaxID=103827 RepID=A0A0N5D639_THECL|nr:unnamed protein product [Thelazia callipaeda]
MSDPVAEFLAREQDVLAGIEDDSLGPLTQLNNGAVDSNGGFSRTLNALFVVQILLTNGSNFGLNRVIGLNEVLDLDMDLHTFGGTINSNGFQRPNSNSYSPVNSLLKVEPEKIKKWREDQKIMLDMKDKDEERKKNEMKAAGRKELEDWYAQRAEKLAKTRIANRKAEEDFILDRDSAKNGGEWERIVKLCEFNPKNSKNSSDLSRLKSLLLQLKTQKE